MYSCEEEYNEAMSGQAEADMMADMMAQQAQEVQSLEITWIKYDFQNKDSRPPIYDKYFVMRKDGKVHWETWNGSGWAYNENSIVWWAKIELPK